ncbi:MAG TPA: hypothetical protein V6D17_24030, partial [Candidatus Obscuribacterales bacterium]
MPQTFESSLAKPVEKQTEKNKDAAEQLRTQTATERFNAASYRSFQQASNDTLIRNGTLNEISLFDSQADKRS